MKLVKTQGRAPNDSTMAIPFVEMSMRSPMSEGIVSDFVSRKGVLSFGRCSSILMMMPGEQNE